MKKQGRNVENWIESYVDYCSGQEAPEIFNAWVAISVIATVLRRNVWLPSSGDNDSESRYYHYYPNFYIILVSPSGACRKSAAISIGNSFLRQIEGLNIYRDKLTPEGLLAFLKDNSRLPSTDLVTHAEVDLMLQKMDESGKTKKEKEEFKEAIQNKIASEYNMQSEAVLIAPELSTMFGGAAYVSDLRVVLTNLYDGNEDNEYGTKHGGRVRIYNVNVNFLGGSNPEWLARSLPEDSFGGGFMGRTMFIHQTKTKRIAWPTRTPRIVKLGKKLIADLQRISKLQGPFSVTKDAWEFMDDWYNKLPIELGTKMSGYYNRKQTHVNKLAMVLAAAFDDNLQLDTLHFRAAIKLIEQVEAWLPEALSLVGASAEARVGEHIIGYLKNQGTLVKASTLLRHVEKDIKGQAAFNEIMRTLVAGERVIRGKDILGDGNTYYAMREDYEKLLKQLESTKESERQRQAAIVEDEVAKRRRDKEGG